MQMQVSFLVLVVAIVASVHSQSTALPNAATFSGNIWAVLVAGSNGYENYRHQADVCHAYQVIKSHGVPDDRIIVMMYDDIAHNKLNPRPGEIINHPKGKNVYTGVPKDYTRKEVTPENFLNVLIANETLVRKGKKVLNSTHNDHVFIFFADHGAPGLLAFPESELMASDLLKTLHKMNEKRMFKHLVFYVEACESGSMFKKKLPNNIDIFAVTAANDQESSYACYYDDLRQTFLGDVFSVEWIEDSEKRLDLDTESVQEQYRLVTRLTNTSHVMEFGDMSIGRLPLGQFQGERPSAGNDETPRIDPFLDAVPSHDVPLIIAQRRAKAATDPFERAHLTAKYQGMLNARAYMKSAVQSLTKKLQSHGVIPGSNDLFREKRTLTRTTCYESLYRTFDEYCFDLSTHPHSLRFLYVLVNACESMTAESSELISQASDLIREHCSIANLSDSLFRSIR